jgi:L-threonylcarbamoyladenylate synthase
MDEGVKARILSPTAESFHLAAEAIRRGEVVGMPTETVYGLAGDAFNPFALARIFSTKERPSFDPLIVHVGLSMKRIEDLSRAGIVDSKKLSKRAQENVNLLTQAFWPGPLTLVLPKTEKIPDLATSGLQTVGIRMPNHSVAQALIAASMTPLAAPSANRFGRISPTSSQDVLEELGDKIDWILDGGEASIGVESTILSIGETGELTLLRPGGLPLEKIEALLSVKVAMDQKDDKILAPGMLASHYSPKKKLTLLPENWRGQSESFASFWREFSPEFFEDQKKIKNKMALLVISGDATEPAEFFSRKTGLPTQGFSLSKNGNLEEAAQNLFKTLRQMDASDAVALFSETCADHGGLGFAIADRLSRASSSNS